MENKFEVFFKALQINFIFKVVEKQNDIKCIKTGKYA